MKPIFSILSFLLITMLNGQSKPSVEEIITSNTIFQLDSKYFPNEKRTIKISVPEGYDDSKKYPTIYTLDGSGLFNLTASYVGHLSKVTLDEDRFDYGTDAIPQSIVIGLFHNDRGYETQPNFTSLESSDETEFVEGTAKLKGFLFEELVPFINLKYSTSGYNSIVGHSNTGHFVMCLPFQKANPFKGIIALSVSGDSENFKNKVKASIENNKDSNIFIGYGIKDFGYNEFAQFLEKEIETNNFKVGKFNANHSELPALSLTEGIKHLFKDYRNFNDFKEISSKKDFEITNYIEGYTTKNKVAYGIETKLKEDDFLSLLEMSIRSKNRNAMAQILKYDSEINGVATQTHMLFIYNNQIEDFEKAEHYANKMLNSKDDFENRVLKANLGHYYKFFITDLKNTQKGLKFFKEGKNKFEDSKLEFSYFIAKIAFQNKIEKSTGTLNLKYCIRNYKANRYFTKTDLETLSTL